MSRPESLESIIVFGANVSLLCFLKFGANAISSRTCRMPKQPEGVH